MKVTVHQKRKEKKRKKAGVGTRIRVLQLLKVNFDKKISLV